MRRSKKFVLVTVLATVVLVGSITGVVLAQNGDDSQPKAGPEALLGRVCEIYQQNTGDEIDPEALKDAFAQVKSEMRVEALQNRLQYLVEQGRITQDEADQYLEWQKSRPEVPVGFGFRGRCGHPCWGGLQAPQPAE